MFQEQETMHVPSANCGDGKTFEGVRQWKVRYFCKRDFELSLHILFLYLEVSVFQLAPSTELMLTILPEWKK